MADKVAARKHSVVIVVSVAPDVCTMPSGVTACFDLVAVGTDAIDYCTSVRFNGSEAINCITQLERCSGDESAASGIASGTINGPVHMIPNGSTVNSQGQPTMRDGDAVYMNNKNTPGIIKVLEDGADLGLDAVTTTGEMANKAADAEAEARKKKNNRPRNRGKTKKAHDKAQERYAEARRNSDKLQFPGGKSRFAKAAGNLVKKVPGVGHAMDVYSVGSEVIAGNACGVLVNSAGVGAGAASGAGGGWVCAALGAAGGAPGVLCAGAVIVISWGASKAAEAVAEGALGTDSCPATTDDSVAPGLGEGGGAGPAPAPAPTPSPSPAVASTPNPSPAPSATATLSTPSSPATTALGPVPAPRPTPMP